MKPNLVKTTATLFVFFIAASTSLLAQADNYKWSIKLGGGSSRIITSGTTNELIGNRKGPQITAGIGFKSIHLNVTYNYFNGELQQDLPYNDYIFPAGAKFRMVFFNLGFSYEQELKYRFFIEPHLSYLRDYITSNIIDGQGNEIEIDPLNGMTLGLSLIKYFKITNGFFLGPYFNTNYNFIGFNSLNSELTNNAFGYSFGVLIKGTSRK